MPNVRTMSELEVWARKNKDTQDPLFFDKEFTQAQNEMLDKLFLYAQQGSSLKTIAQSFGVDLGTMKRYFRTELGADAVHVYEKAKAIGQLETEGTLFDMTNTGKDFNATKFWLEKRCKEKWGGVDDKPVQDVVVHINKFEADV